MLDVISSDHHESFSLASGRRVDALTARAVPHYGELLETIVELGEDAASEGGAVYDVGCGTGTAIESLARRLGAAGRAGRFIGIDLSETMLARAEYKLRGLLGEHEISLRRVDASAISYPDASLVLMNYCLQHLPAAVRGATLERVYAGLRPRGLLILSERLAPLAPRQYERFRAERGVDPLAVSQGAPMPWRELATLLADAGFDAPEPILARHGYTTVVAKKGL